MKEFSYKRICWIIAIVLVITSCVEPVSVPNAGGEEDLYSISFCVQTQDDALLTKTGEGGPLSGADAVVQKLFMYCFDENGRYLGRFQATNLTPETLEEVEEGKYEYTMTPDPGTFKGQIPPATARIHFVANADRPVGNDKIGMTEEQVMHDPDLVYVTKDDPISYWGYLSSSEVSSGVLSDLFKEDSNHKPTTIVWMVRDRLVIESGSNSYDPSVYYSDIEWIVYNGLNKGYVAPRVMRAPNLPAHPNDWLDTDNPYQTLNNRYTYSATAFWLPTVVTPYPESGGRFVTTEEMMVPFDKQKEGYKPMYVFDDECPATQPDRVVKLIIKARYKNAGPETGEGAAPYRYFPVCITHGYSDESIPLKRGHRYELDIKTIPEAYGYLDDPQYPSSGKSGFQKAAEALSFANGSLVDIPDEVIEVADGSFLMRVNYQMEYPLSKERFNSTAVLVQNNQTSVTVPFTVSKQANSDMKFFFTESGWLSETEGTPAHNPNIPYSWGSELVQETISGKTEYTKEIGNDLVSTVTLPLIEVGSDLKQSTFNLKGYYLAAYGGQDDVKHTLMRNVVVYSIEEFQIQSGVYATTGNGYNTFGNLSLQPVSGQTDVYRSFGNLSLQPVSGQTDVYRLKFKLPKGNNAYPALLYPLQIKIATNTLQPFVAYVEGKRQGSGTTSGGQPTNVFTQAVEGTWKDEVFGVQVRTTEPGVSPANLSSQSNSSQWNYQSTDNYWNFWYTYPLASIPTSSSGEEIEGPEIWIDLKDIRGSGALLNVPENVGLYLYIEFFGPANEVSYTATAPPVTVQSVSISVQNPASGQENAGHDEDNRYSIVRSNRGTTSTLQLIATVKPNTATNKNVTWESSNSNRATVNESGLVTITRTDANNNNRDVTITARSESDNTIMAKFFIRVTNP